MRDSIRLGRLGGVTIAMNWSLILIAVLIATGLANSRLPTDAPGATTTSYVVAAGITAVALLAAVLLHELGHAVVALRFGMKVDGITLSWLGGITRIEGDTRSPATEFLISAVGPAVSLAVGGLLWVLRLPLEPGGHHRLIVACLGWLAVINVALAVFNLVPASPLDGGRILHSLIWRTTGDRARATRYASRAGVALGGLLVFYGFSRILSPGGELNGFVIAVLGFWIVSSARAEEMGGQVQAVLEHLRVSDLMRPVGAAPGWVTARTFIELYDSPHPGWVWLLERWGQPGYDAVVAGESLRMVPPAGWDTVRPRELASPAEVAVAARAGEPVLDALRRTDGHQVLLVIEGGRTVGAVLPSDVQAVLRTRRRPAWRWPAPAGAGTGR